MKSFIILLTFFRAGGIIFYRISWGIIMKSEGKTCSFTGHRTIKPEHFPAITDLLSRAISYAYSEGCRRFICGGAKGFDTLAAKEVIRFRMTHPDVSLLLYLPCTNQDELWSRWDKNTYAYVTGVADEIKYFAEGYVDGCMRKRNRAMAEDCDILIAYVGRDKSGGAQTVRMATGMGKRVYNLFCSLEKNV